MTLNITGPVERLARMKKSWPSGPIRARDKARLLLGKRRLKKIVDVSTTLVLNQAARIDDTEKRSRDNADSDSVSRIVGIED